MEEHAKSRTARRRAVSSAVKTVAAYLGNTPTVCRASYIDPRVIDRYHSASTIALTLRRMPNGPDLADVRTRARIEAAAVLERFAGRLHDALPSLTGRVLPDARWPSNAGSGRRVDRTLIRDEREKLERTVQADLHDHPDAAVHEPRNQRYHPREPTTPQFRTLAEPRVRPASTPFRSRERLDGAGAKRARGGR